MRNLSSISSILSSVGRMVILKKGGHTRVDPTPTLLCARTNQLGCVRT